MALNKIFEEARSHPPLNESTTCDWVIVPVLQEIGYASREIVSRLADNHGQFPDYTLLPETSHTWYLEAKDWRNALQDNHAQQALNYANQNGRRWVVLTNGNEWRLYDNRVMGPAPEKLVTRRPSDDFPALEELLRALGRDSLVSGGLERFALRSRFRRFMEEQLRDEQSEVIRAIRQILRRQVGLADVSAREIRDYLGEGRSAVPESKLAPSPEPGPVPVPEPGPVPVPVPASDPPLGSEYGLDILSAQPKGSELVTGRKPVGVVFPDGTVVPVQSWNELACEVVRWVGSRH
ncbi:MAG: hypothetical protein FJX77_15815, partial [Armatimonadetes bacterium]|nr:hypothetical protein [Armatimonadota bacterium]